MKEKKSKIRNYSVPLFEEEMEQLKKAAKTMVVKEALTIAVEEYIVNHHERAPPPSGA